MPALWFIHIVACRTNPPPTGLKEDISAEIRAETEARSKPRVGGRTRGYRPTNRRSYATHLYMHRMRIPLDTTITCVGSRAGNQGHSRGDPLERGLSHWIGTGLCLSYLPAQSWKDCEGSSIKIQGQAAKLTGARGDSSWFLRHLGPGSALRHSLLRQQGRSVGVRIHALHESRREGEDHG